MNYGKIVLILTIAIIFTIIALFLINQKYPNNSNISYVYQKTSSNTHTSTTPTTKNIIADNSKFIIPDAIFLKVPFTPQAPTANWDELHNEACEEASAIMTASYFLCHSRESGNPVSGSPGTTFSCPEDDSINLSPKFVEEEIIKLTEWQQKTFGYNLSINSWETVKMVKETYGLNAEIKKNFLEDDIKKALAENKLILFPANGRKLHNPNYKQPGPIYHMLVIKGYDSKGNFITNDPGTRKGLNYPYTFKVLYEANGNWDHNKNSVDLSAKNIILVWK